MSSAYRFVTWLSLFISAAQHVHTADILSRPFQATPQGESCQIRFYIPFGTKDIINVDAITAIKVAFITSTTGSETPLALPDYHGDYFQQRVVALTSNTPFKILFHSDFLNANANNITYGRGCINYTGYFPYGDTPCSPTQFRCYTDGKCIEAPRRCDGNFDCSAHDSSDEQNCPCTRYCLNQGSCSLDESGLRVCRCANGNHVTTCQYIPFITSPPTTKRYSTVYVSPPSDYTDGAPECSTHVVVVVGVFAFVIGILATVVTVYLHRTNRIKRCWSQRSPVAVPQQNGRMKECQLAVVS